MNYKYYFSVPSYSTNEAIDIPCVDNLNFWAQIMEYFLDQSESIEIHCWDEESAVIEELKNVCGDAMEIKQDGLLTVFNIKKSPSFKQFLLQNYIDEHGRVKWFSIFLSSQETTVFHSEHWGTEFFAPCVNEKEIEFIQSVMPIDTNFHQYT